MMMLNKDRLLEKINEMEKYLQLASENLLDICNLIISEKGFGIPTDSKDCIRKLTENGVIPVPLSSRLEELVGFRNLLVHQYGRIDDSKAYSYLNVESKDFYEFMEVIDKYIYQN